MTEDKIVPPGGYLLRESLPPGSTLSYKNEMARDLGISIDFQDGGSLYFELPIGRSFEHKLGNVSASIAITHLSDPAQDNEKDVHLH
ncbi:MAG: hypothetical protein AB7V13_06260 [Pseudorhodoplanes sp.]|uniref:hypothetical protein n=1 Tax=Pseudorhodoplanes sp. TaxID=1934341 RepID=UPI003D0C7CDA